MVYKIDEERLERLELLIGKWYSASKGLDENDDTFAYYNKRTLQEIYETIYGVKDNG